MCYIVPYIISHIQYTYSSLASRLAGVGRTVYNAHLLYFGHKPRMLLQVMREILVDIRC